VSDVRRLKVYEQARAHWGEESAEILMELVVPAGQDMATKADIESAVDVVAARMDRIDVRMDGLATKEHVLRTLMLALLPVYLGTLGILGSIIGLHFTG
jgi:hypothetical protein